MSFQINALHMILKQILAKELQNPDENPDSISSASFFCIWLIFERGLFKAYEKELLKNDFLAPCDVLFPYLLLLRRL